MLPNQHTLGDTLAQGRKLTAEEVHHLGHDALIAVVFPKCATLWKVNRSSGKYRAQNLGAHATVRGLEYFVLRALEGKVLLLDGQSFTPPSTTQAPPTKSDETWVVKPGELRTFKKAVYGSPNQGLVSGWAGYED